MGSVSMLNFWGVHLTNCEGFPRNSIIIQVLGSVKSPKSMEEKTEFPWNNNNNNNNNNMKKKKKNTNEKGQPF